MEFFIEFDKFSFEIGKFDSPPPEIGEEIIIIHYEPSGADGEIVFLRFFESGIPRLYNANDIIGLDIGAVFKFPPFAFKYSGGI
jgi:hypothetical protein